MTSKRLIDLNQNLCQSRILALMIESKFQSSCSIILLTTIKIVFNINVYLMIFQIFQNYNNEKQT